MVLIIGEVSGVQNFLLLLKFNAFKLIRCGVVFNFFNLMGKILFL